METLPAGKRQWNSFWDVPNSFVRRAEEWNSKMDPCPGKANPFDVRNYFFRNFLPVSPHPGARNTLALPPRTPRSTQSPGVDLYCRRRFLWGCGCRGAAAAASHATFTGKSHFCRILAPCPRLPVSMACACVPSTSEAPQNLHLLFICLCLWL